MLLLLLLLLIVVVIDSFLPYTLPPFKEEPCAYHRKIYRSCHMINAFDYPFQRILYICLANKENDNQNSNDMPGN